nr:MAG TPA: hypothetical protein [Microviridae sp.]
MRARVSCVRTCVSSYIHDKGHRPLSLRVADIHWSASDDYTRRLRGEATTIP